MTKRENFEAAWRAEYPLHGKTTFQRSGFNPEAYVNTRVQDGWLMWQASRSAALEEAAMVCDDFAIERWNLYKGRPPYNGTEDGRANSYVEGESDGADKCSAAIRKLAKETNNG